MKDIRQNKVYLLIAVLSLATACQLEKGSEFPFSEECLTVHVEENGLWTRATVNGHYSEDNLTWLASDLIAVHLSNGEYDIVKVYPNSEDLTWGTFICSTTSEISRDYYAVYPASMVDDNNYGQDATHPLTLKLPSRYEAIGWAESYTRIPMVAVNTVTNPTGGRAHLEFYHVGGLLRITLTEVPSGTKVIRVTFDKSVTGSFAVTNPASNSPTITSPATPGSDNGSTVTFIVADATHPIDPSEDLYVNVPLPVGSYNSVTVETFESESATVSTKSYSHIFDLVPLQIIRQHGKKLSFTTLTEDVDIEVTTSLDDIDLGGTEVLGEHDENIVVEIDKEQGSVVVGHASWKAYFSADAPTGTMMDDSWSATPLQDSGGNDWLTLSAYEGDGDSNSITVSVSPAPASAVRVPGTNAVSMISYMRTAPAVNDMDLSRFDITKGPYDALDATNKAETANCYVIKKYGTYLIPCVYGNAYKGGPNTVAYSNSTVPAPNVTIGGVSTPNPVLNGFINADGNAINHHVITSDSHLSKSSNLVARVVWQDVQPGFEILKDSDLQYISTPGTAVNCPYIRVNFRQDAIVPGNVVIALYDNDNSKILWSWHLWITSEPLTTIDLQQHDDTPLKILNVNLGWTPPISYTGGTSPERTQYVIIVSQENDRAVGWFKVSQASYKQQRLDCVCYSDTRYQWGRKDPFLPATGSSSNKSITHPTDFPAGESGSRYIATIRGDLAGSTKPERLKNMVRYPYKFITEPEDAVTYYPFYCNLWNAASNQIGEDRAVTKTVYDPSPRGFQTTNRNAFTGFTSNGGFGSTVPGSANRAYGVWVDQVGERPAGMILSDSRSVDEETWVVYFPAAGSRGYETGETTGDGTWGNIRYSALYTDRYGYDFGFAYYAASPLNTPNRFATAFGVRPMVIPNN